MKKFGIAWRHVRLASWLVAAAGIVIAQTSCGGGGGGDGVVGSGGTGVSQPTVSVGAISGFGSIIVNGIKYDDSSASLSRDDKSALARSDLRLGMFVEVRGVANSTTSLGTASSVVVTSELQGLVDSGTASAFSVLGVSVRTNANTVYENTSSVQVGDFLEVYGVFDAQNKSMLATRIEKKSVLESKLRGIVSGLDINARRFSIGNVLIDYRNVAAIAGLANGVEIRVAGAPPPSTGAWTISSAVTQAPVTVNEASRVELEAVIEQYSSLSNFRVSGLQIDGSTAVLEGGAASGLAPGVRVEIKGTVQSGIVRASKIEIKDGVSSGTSGGGTSSGGTSSGGTSSGGTSSGGTSSGGTSSGGTSSGGTGSGEASSSEFEVKGTISGFVSASSFLVRGTRINASGTVSFEGGSATSLANGVCTEIKGMLASSPTGSVLTASRIKFDDGC